MARAHQAWVRRLFLVLLCAWPLALHLAVEFASPAWPPRINAIVIGIGLVVLAVADGRLAVALLVVPLLLLLGTIVLYMPAILLFAPTVIINAVVASFFGASLMPGREPVIALFARFEQGGALPTDLSSHARAVTWCWTLLLAANAVLALALAVWAPLETWSLFANVIVYVMIGTLFVGEYAYRRVRFRHYRHGSLWALLRSVRNTRLFPRR